MVVLSEHGPSISLKEQLLAYIRERFERWRVRAMESETAVVSEVSVVSIYKRLNCIELCYKSLRGNGFDGEVSRKLAEKTLDECEDLGLMKAAEIRDWRERFGLIDGKPFDTVECNH